MSQLCVATVIANGTTTRYLRAGRGPLVVSLWQPDHCIEPLLDRMILGLSRQCRVVAPLVPALAMNPGPGRLWLEGFLDGLGISGAGVVAAGPLEPTVSAVAQQECGRIRSVLILREIPPDAEGVERVCSRVLQVA